MTSIKETVGFLGRVILIRVGGLISDAAAQKVQSLEKELADMSSELESALSAAKAFAERMEALQALWDSPHHHEECELRWVRAEAELERMRADLAAAAGECRVPCPEPGTDLARVVIANRLLHREFDRVQKEMRRIAWRLEKLGLSEAEAIRRALSSGPAPGAAPEMKGADHGE